VISIPNGTHEIAKKAIYQCLRKAQPDDLVLIYYSGHGKLDEDGNLYLAAKDTVIEALPPTSIPIEDIKKYIQFSSASKIVVILDCCFSGAVKRMFKGAAAEQASHALQELEGEGRFYLTASTDIQLAEEKEGDQYSLLTKHIIDGIAEGFADSNDDGRVSFQELCSYVQSRVPREGRQRPKSWFIDTAGDVTVAFTGKPAFESRKKEITAKLYELASKGLITDDTVRAVLDRIAQPTATVRRSANRDVIGSLYSKISKVPDFIEEAVRVSGQSNTERSGTAGTRAEVRRWGDPTWRWLSSQRLWVSIVVLLSLTVLIVGAFRPLFVRSAYSKAERWVTQKFASGQPPSSSGTSSNAPSATTSSPTGTTSSGSNPVAGSSSSSLPLSNPVEPKPTKTQVPRKIEYIDWWAQLEPHLSWGPEVHLKGWDSSTKLYRVKFWLTGPPSTLSKIERVEYFFVDDTDTFHPNPKIGKTPSNGFMIAYNGWGCLLEMRITVFPSDQAFRTAGSASTNFAFCDELKRIWTPPKD
jgi:hypothetical protein